MISHQDEAVKVHKPFSYKGGHPSYPEPIKGSLRLCVLDDGIALIRQGWKSETVELHIPREQIREVRSIDESTSLDRKVFVDVGVELNGVTYTARFQAAGMHQIEDGIRLTMEIKQFTAQEVAK